ncbi:MAG: hypothetical protein KGJ06_04110 [Pseudomonadota bacterium]|nr:hypothetical protein [Pseudomonadota bacterium]
MEKHLNSGNTQVLLDITQNTIYLMGASFILGSLFTIFLLLVLDFVRRNKTESQS